MYHVLSCEIFVSIISHLLSLSELINGLLLINFSYNFKQIVILYFCTNTQMFFRADLTLDNVDQLIKCDTNENVQR